MNLHLDVNKLVQDSFNAIQHGLAPWIVFGLVILIMSPWIIPALSKAIAEQRKLSHKREINLQKIRNSAADKIQRDRSDRR